MEQNIRVLVVDDEKRFRDNIVKILNNKSMEAQGAEDGEQALAMTEAEKFDVILLDMKMPGISGKETLHHLQQNGTDAEVIVLTGHASVSGALDMMELGAFDYLLKPAPVDDLLKKVRLAGEKKFLREGRIGMQDILSAGT